MTLVPRSLAGRLLLSSLIVTLVMLLTILVLVDGVMTRFVTGQVDQRLDNKIVALASQVRVGADGQLSLVGEADGPPYDRPEHHAFWLVSGGRGDVASRWLARRDVEIPSRDEVVRDLADRPSPPGPAPAGLDGPPQTFVGHGWGERLHLRAASVAEPSGVPVVVLVAAPAAAIRGPVREAMTTVGVGIFGLALVLAGLAFLQIRIGLRPLAALRTEVRAVSEGRRDTLPLGQPAEVLPLVVELNRLLARNTANLEKARRHVANLAHGLKTPLATLSLSIGRYKGAGMSDVSALLREIDDRIRHHLGRARAGVLAGAERATTPLTPRLVDLGAALERIYAEQGVQFAFDAGQSVAVACEAHDVDEIFGNLLDNAFKFARTRVSCSMKREALEVVVTISDDGAGLPASELPTILEPGRRLDESMPGFGFGLTIARELIELYGGDLALSAGDGRGLTTIVRLPAATDPTV